MNKDDQVYMLLLVATIPLGLLFKKGDFDPITKKFLSTLIGLSIASIVSSYDIFHSILVVLINNCILILFHPRNVHKLSFIWCFGYLLFFRLTHLFSLPTPVAYANAIQLVLTLKVISILVFLSFKI